MEKTTQKNEKPKSLLPVEKTDGEKAYHKIFENGINFWVNLAMSGLFSFWVEQSTRPLPKFIFKEKRPLEFYHMVRDQFHASPLVKWLPEATEASHISPRMRMATVLANCITITFSATAVLIPSVWLGPKIKERFVKWWDKRRYGPNAEQDEHIHERHEIVANEERPTLLGSAVSRVGTIAAVTASGLVLGSHENFLRPIGKLLNINKLAHFKGVDHYAGRLGDFVGEEMTKSAPEASKKINDFFVRHGFDWREGIPHPEGPFNHAVQDWSRWTALDVFYTSVTAYTIMPFVKLVRQLPGMSYKPKHQATENPSDKHLLPLKVQKPLPDDTHKLPSAEDKQLDSDKPKARVAHIANHSTLSSSLQAEVGAAG